MSMGKRNVECALYECSLVYLRFSRRQRIHSQSEDIRLTQSYTFQSFDCMYITSDAIFYFFQQQQQLHIKPNESE